MKWRLLDLKYDIYAHHATEEYFLQQEKSAPVVIVSQIMHPGISVSDKQDIRKDVDIARCDERKVHYTRRKSGGRSVFLDGNSFLLSLVANAQNLGIGMKNVVEAYRVFCSLVSSSLASILEVPVLVDEKNDLLLSDRRKIGGVAQRNRGQRVLLHSYIRYVKNWEYALQFLRVDNHPLEGYAREFNEFTTSVREMKDLEYELFKEMMIRNFLSRRVYVREPLAVDEVQAIEKVKKQYRDSTWILGVGRETFSRGNCDLIAGSELKIKSLEGVVRFR